MAKPFLRGKLRRGTTSVEAAVVLPVFFAFLFAILQIGHASMIEHLLQHGCRSAARLGSTEGVTTAAVIAKAREVIGLVIDPANVNVIVKDATSLDDLGQENLPATNAAYAALPDIELANAASRQPFLVRAQVSYNGVALLPIPFTQNLTLTAQTMMRHE